MKYAFILFLLMLLLSGFAKGDTARTDPPDVPTPTAAETVQPAVTPEATQDPTPQPLPYSLSLATQDDWEAHAGERFLTALANVHFSGKTAIPGSELTYASICISDEFSAGTRVFLAVKFDSEPDDPRVEAASIAARLKLDVDGESYLPSAAFLSDDFMLVCFPVQLPDDVVFTLDALTLRASVPEEAPAG